jgi:hypothetical protein
MYRFRKVIAATVVTALSAGGAAIGLVNPAGAVGLPWGSEPNSAGSLAFFNAQGQQITGGNLTDAPLAAYVEGSVALRANDTKATLFAYTPVNGVAPGAWSGEQLSGSTVYPNASAPGALASATLPIVSGAATDASLSSYIGDLPNTDTSSDGYAGLYELRLKTAAQGVSQTATYDSAVIQVSGSTWSIISPAPALTATTTTLTSSPSTTAVGGTSVALTATVSPSAPGSVQFKVGSQNLGSPVTVSGGTAQLSTSSLPVGTDSLSAVFTPAQFSAYSGSTGSESLSVTAPPAASTTTALSVNPSTAVADSAVGITANVSNAGGALGAGDGSVTFYDDGSDSSGQITSNSVNLGSVALGANGAAVLNFGSFATGSHYLVASFAPTNSVVNAASTSSAVLFPATAPTSAPATAGVDVTIPSGALTISTPYSASNPFQLGTAVLSPSNGQFTASAPFGSATNPAQGVTITDTRAGEQPWSAAVTATNFSDASGDTIPASDLTFTNVAGSFLAGNALQSGSIVTTDVASGLSGGPHVFASAAQGDGSVYIDGLLSLVAPSSVKAGNYVATLTFTIT